MFVAPFLLETTLRFVRAAAGVEHIRLGLVSQDPARRIPGDLRSSLAAHYQIARGLDTDQIVSAVQKISASLGPVQRVISTLEELQVPLARVRQRLGLPGIDVETAHNFRDKGRMKEVLQQAGVPCARHATARSLPDVQAFVERVGFPLVVKPPAGAAAKDTFRLNSEAELQGYLRHYRPSSQRPVLLEEFIQGEEYSFDSVCQGGKVVWSSISRYYPTPLEVLQNPWIQWCVLLPRELEQPQYQAMREVGQAGLQALGLRDGFSHMEWFHRKDGSVAISEVGARPPGAQFTSLISYAHDHDFYAAYCRLMLRDAFSPPARKYAVGAAYLRGQGRGRVRAVHGLDEAQRKLGELVVEARLPREGQPAGSGYEGEGYVILRHPDTEVVKQGLARLIRLVRVELRA